MTYSYWGVLDYNEQEWSATTQNNVWKSLKQGWAKEGRHHGAQPFDVVYVKYKEQCMKGRLSGSVHKLIASNILFPNLGDSFGGVLKFYQLGYLWSMPFPITLENIVMHTIGLQIASKHVKGLSTNRLLIPTYI